jgi:uncharacterized protein (DUF2235 family)
MDSWEPEDRLFLFGFSRGAYTVRVLAGMIYALGLLPRGSYNLVPYAVRLFKSLRTDAEDRSAAQWKLFKQFQRTFARDLPAHQGVPPIHFLGVLDTVSSVGWVWNQATYPYTKSNPNIRHVRHAVAIDERRAFYRQNLLQEAEGQTLKEYWFPGVHSDVGGGYAKDDGSLWVPPFQWIVNEARDQQLAFNDQRLARILEGTPNQPWRSAEHQSLTALWWFAELFPKLHWQDGVRRLRINRGRARWIPTNAAIDKSALLKIRETGYRPKNFLPELVEEIIRLNQIPDTLAFHW